MMISLCCHGTACKLILEDKHAFLVTCRSNRDVDGIDSTGYQEILYEL